MRQQRPHVGTPAPFPSFTRLLLRIPRTCCLPGAYYGAPRIHKALQRSVVACSRKRVAKIMRRIGLRSKATRRFRIQTTDSKHDHPIAPDLLKRNFSA